MWKNSVFEEAESYFYSILRLFLIYSNVFNVKVWCPPDQNPSDK
jgi:hypothetical protein